MEENEKKRGTGKRVLFIFAVLLSFLFVPLLFISVPVGGAITAVSDMVSMESIEKELKESEVSEKFYDLMMEEMKEVDREDIKDMTFEKLETIFRDSFAVEDMEKVFLVFLNSAYYGTEEKVDFSGIEKKFKKNFETLYTDAFDDLYSVWRNGTKSEYFSEEFCRSFCEQAEKEIMDEYPDYGAIRFDELEEKYDAQNGKGAFAKLLDERTENIRQEWLDEIAEDVNSQIEDFVAAAEETIQEAAYEAARNPETREAFDTLRKIGDNRNRIRVVVYAVILGMVLILVLLYWLEIPGFIVCSVPLLLGGTVCMILGSIMKNGFMSYISEAIFSELSEPKEYEDLLRALIDGIISPLFKGISDFGMTAVILGIILIGCAVLRGILKQNKKEAEQQLYS